MRRLRSFWADAKARLWGGRSSRQTDQQVEQGSGPAVRPVSEPDRVAALSVTGKEEAEHIELFTSVHVTRQRTELTDPPVVGPEARERIDRAFAGALGLREPLNAVERLIDKLDAELTMQMNIILHAPELQQLEAAWRGLHHLVSNTETSEKLKIRVLNISLSELNREARATPWDEGFLFKVLHDDTFRRIGGEPYACFVGDFEFAHNTEDVHLLRSIGMVAAAIQAPFIAGASPSLLGVESWRDIDWANVSLTQLDDPDHTAWQHLRDQEQARLLGLCLPRLVARTPYGGIGDAVEEFAFEEDADARSGRNVLWINAAYAMAINMNRAQTIRGWCTRFHGVGSSGDGEVRRLPSVLARGDDERATFRVSSIEAEINDRSETGLAKAGLIAVVQRKNADRAFFLSAQSMFRPRRFEGDGAITSIALDQISARLPYMIPVYRFVHYLRVLIRDNGGCVDPSSATRELQAWLDGYVNEDPSQSNEAAQAQRPLVAGRIDILADEEHPGSYKASLSLRLLYQFEGVDLDIPLVWPLPNSVQSA